MTQTDADAARPVLAYPIAEPRPETVEFGGIRYDDPFRWLEEDTDPGALVWQAAQDRLAQSYLDALPAFARFSDRLQAIADADDFVVPVFAGDRWFLQHVPEGENFPVVEVRDEPTIPGRRIFDLNRMQTAGEPLQLIHFIPSPDGRKAIVAWAAGGREEPNLQIIDVDSGAMLVDGVPQKQPSLLAWLPDSSGILYMDIANAPAAAQLFRLALDRPKAPLIETVAPGFAVIQPIPSADGRHVLLSADHLAPRPHFLLDTKGDGLWQPFLKDVAGIFRGDILGDRYVAITDNGAARGRLVAIPLATPTEHETWQEIVPPSDDVLVSVLIAGDRIVLLSLVDTYARLRVYDRRGVLEREIALPGRGMVNNVGRHHCLFNMMDPMARAGEGRIVFGFSTPAHSPTLCVADVANGVVTELAPPRVRIDVQVHDFTGISADGAPVAYHVVVRRDIDLSQKPPTMITGYGGFNIAVLPGWLGSRSAAWIEAGGVLVLAHLRGGGEFGTLWFEQGRLKHKQNSFNDVYAVAEDLIERGFATPDRLGVIGGSNGGVMAAVAVVQRPELFRVSVAQVPIADILARVRDPITMVSSLDYGDPRDPEMAKSLLGWSPYQNVRDGVAYPALLVDSGLNDPRCPPWHGRKLAARLQQANSGDRPILLRVREGAGHGAVGKAEKVRQSAEVFAFVADQLGLEI